MGYPDSNKTIYIAVCRLCRDYEINAADDTELEDKHLKPEVLRDAARARVWAVVPDLVEEARNKRLRTCVDFQREAAKRALRQQIELAIAEAPTAPPYKPKELVW